MRNVGILPDVCRKNDSPGMVFGWIWPRHVKGLLYMITQLSVNTMQIFLNDNNIQMLVNQNKYCLHYT